MPTFRKKMVIAFPRLHVTQRHENFKSYISLLGCKISGEGLASKKLISFDFIA